MKKITSLFVAILILMLSVSGVCAADVTTLSVGNVEVYAEDAQNVLVPISITSNPGFASCTLKLEYDKDALEVNSIRTTGNAVSVTPVYNIQNAEGWAKIVVAGAVNVMSDGDIFNVEFSAKDGVYGEYPVKLTAEYFANSDYDDIDCEIVEGSITVKKSEPEPTPAPTAAPVVKMEDTTDVEGTNKSITSLISTVDLGENSYDVLNLKWNVTYDQITKSYDTEYKSNSGTVFTGGSVRVGLYIENLYVADKSLLDVNVELGKGE